MTQLSRNFSRDEFECACCGEDTVDAELVTVLQDVRDYFRLPIKVTSGYRCFDHNRSIGGSKHSMHLKGRAADIKVKDIAPSIVQTYLVNKYPDTYGIGLYKTFVHIDTRSELARWAEV